jgi:hypothetical protein
MSAFRTKPTEAGQESAVVLPTSATLTSSNVHRMSTYELRQELVRRNCLDIPEAEINHNTMLQRLIQVLVIEEANATEAHTVAVVDKAQEERDAAKAVREQRKAEALERSKARQADPNYFRNRQEASNKAKETPQVSAAVVEEETADEDEDVDYDPFRAYKSKGRAKIAGFI